MIATKFTIELDIGLSFLLQAALPQLVTDRETKTHRHGQSERSYDHCRHRTEIPEAERQSLPPRGRRTQWLTEPMGDDDVVIVVVEGLSAAGKTTWCRRHAWPS